MIAPVHAFDVLGDPGPAADPRAARRRGADLGGVDRRRPGRVRDLAAGRLAAPQGPARERLRDRPARRRRDGCMPSTRRRSRRSTCGSTSSAASGDSVSTHWPPSWRAASASGASPPRRPTDRRRTRSMIDIVREIDAVQREVGQRPDRSRGGTHGPPATHLRRADRGRLGCLDRPRADQPLVPADQWRAAASAGDISWRAMPAARSSPASRRIGSG